MSKKIKKWKKLSKEQKWEAFQKYREPVPEDLKDNPYYKLYEVFLKQIVTYEPLELKPIKPMKGLSKGEIYWPEWIDKMPKPWLNEEKEKGIPNFEHIPPPPPPPPCRILKEGHEPPKPPEPKDYEPPMPKGYQGHPKWPFQC